MPGVVNPSDEDDHDQTMIEALEQFCVSPEQTYEQFLSTFTHLTPVAENVRDPRLTAPGGHRDPSHAEIDNSPVRQGEEVTEMEESEERRMGQENGCSPPADQEEVLLDAGCVGGRLGDPSGSAPDRPVKFDNYLVDSEDEEENVDATGPCALPGEIEEDLITVSSSSLCHHTRLEISSTFTDQRTHTPSASENQDESDAVVPFLLDEGFDYDNVVLSQKYVLQEHNGSPS